MDSRISSLSAGRFMSVQEASDLIRNGGYFSISADESQLRQLPPGNWIGGSIPYFMTEEGGKTSRQGVFVNTVPVWAGTPQIRWYDVDDINRICVNAPDNGFTQLIIPAFSDVHSVFSLNAPNFPEMFSKPLVGWMCGVDLTEIETAKPCVANGQTAELATNRAVAMHVPLPPQYFAQVDIINLFEPSGGDIIRFPKGTRSFSVGECTINGQPARLSDYLLSKKLPPSMPIVADYNGAVINLDIRKIDEQAGEVHFFGPVFGEMPYQLPRPVGDYLSRLDARLPPDTHPAFVCNCVSSYMSAQLEGKTIPVMHGPFTFGEIAYQLVNQTLVYMTIEKV